MAVWESPPNPNWVSGSHTGGLAIPTIVLGELYAGAYKHPNLAKLLTLIANLLWEVDVPWACFAPPLVSKLNDLCWSVV